MTRQLFAADESTAYSGGKDSSGDISDADRKNWTIYSLELPTPIKLQEDMTELANMSKQHSSAVFFLPKIVHAFPRVFINRIKSLY